MNFYLCSILAITTVVNFESDLSLWVDLTLVFHYVQLKSECAAKVDCNLGTSKKQWEAHPVSQSNALHISHPPSCPEKLDAETIQPMKNSRGKLSSSNTFCVGMDCRCKQQNASLSRLITRNTHLHLYITSEHWLSDVWYIPAIGRTWVRHAARV